MDLVTIPAVELCQVGTWNASTGEVTFTPEDLADAVRAAADPGFRTPQVYLGHDHAAWGDAEPAVGRIVNLRVSDDGISLIGDLELLPAIAEVASVAFPSRSIEALLGCTSSTGEKYRMVLTGVALLGAQLPAIETLDDLLEVAGVAASAGGTPITLTFGDSTMHDSIQPTPVAASVNVEDIRRAWWDRTDDLRSGIWQWSWVRAIYTGDDQDDQFLVVQTDDTDPDTGAYLWQVPWTETDGTVTFGEPVPVREAYVPAADEPDEDELGVAASAVCLARFTPTEQGGVLRGGDNAAPSITASADQAQEATHMSDTATAAEAAADTTEETVEVAASGVVQVDAAKLAELTEMAAAGAAAAATLAAQRRESILDEAVKAGKVAPASREHFAALLAKDEDGTVALIESLAPVAPTVELGAATNPEASSEDAEYARLFGTTEA